MSCGRPKFLYIRCDEDSDLSYNAYDRTSLGSVSSDVASSSQSSPSSATSSLSSEGSRGRDVSAYLKRFTDSVNTEEGKSSFSRSKSSYSQDLPKYSDNSSASDSFRSSTPNREENCRYCKTFQNERQYFLWRSQYTRSSFCTRCSKGNREQAYISYWGKPSYENGSWRKRLKEGRNVDIDLTPLIEVLHRIDRMDTSMGKTKYYRHSENSTSTPTYENSNINAFEQLNKHVNTPVESQHSWYSQRKNKKIDDEDIIIQNRSSDRVDSIKTNYDKRTQCDKRPDEYTEINNNEKLDCSLEISSDDFSDDNSSEKSEHRVIADDNNLTCFSETKVKTKIIPKNDSKAKNSNVIANGNRIESKLLDTIVNATDEDEYMSDDSVSNFDKSSSDSSPEGDNNLTNDDKNTYKEFTKPKISGQFDKEFHTNKDIVTKQPQRCSSKENVETEVAGVKTIISRIESMNSPKPQPKNALAHFTPEQKHNTSPEEDSKLITSRNIIDSFDSNTYHKSVTSKNHSNELCTSTASNELDRHLDTVQENTNDESNDITDVKEQFDNAYMHSQPTISVTVEHLNETNDDLTSLDSYEIDQTKLHNNYQGSGGNKYDNSFQSFTPKRVSTPNDTDNKSASARSGSRPESSTGKYQQKRRLSRSQRDRRSSLHQLRTAHDDEDDEFMKIQQKISTLGKFSEKKKQTHDNTETNTITIPKSIWNHTIRKAIYGPPTYFVVHSDEDIGDSSNSCESSEEESSEESSDGTNKDIDIEETQINIPQKQEINDLSQKNIDIFHVQNDREQKSMKSYTGTPRASISFIENDNKNNNERRRGNDYTNIKTSTAVEKRFQRKESIDLQEIRSRRLQVAKSLRTPSITVDQAPDETDCVDLDADDKEVTKLNWRSRGYKYDFFLSRQSRTGTEIIEQYQQTRSAKSSKANSPITSADNSRRSSYTKRARGSWKKTPDTLTIESAMTYRSSPNRSRRTRLESEGSDSIPDSRADSRPDSRRSSDQNNGAQDGISVHKLKAALERASICSDRLDKRLEQQLL